MDIVVVDPPRIYRGSNQRENNGQGVSDSPSAEGLSVLVIRKWITKLWKGYWHIQNNRKGTKNVRCLQ